MNRMRIDLRIREKEEKDNSKGDQDIDHRNGFTDLTLLAKVTTVEINRLSYI